LRLTEWLLFSCPGRLDEQSCMIICRGIMFHVLPFLLLPWLASAAAQADDPVRVDTVRLEAIASYPERSAPATVVSLNDTTITSEVSATVTALPVRVGDVVEPGRVLARLDCTDYLHAQREALASLESLDARIELARKRLERTRLLTERQSLSEDALDERIADLAVFQAERKAAAAGLDSARLNVERCKVTSPYQAVVTERISSVGEYVSTGTPLLRIMDIFDIELSAQVPVDEIVQIERTDEIYFEYAGYRYPVTVRTILPAINSLTRNREVRLLFSRDKALAGAAGKLIWVDQRPHIPANLLVSRGDSLGIFVATERKAVFVPLAGARTGRSTPVSLPPQTRLIVEGHRALEDGDAVRENSQ